MIFASDIRVTVKRRKEPSLSSDTLSQQQSKIEIWGKIEKLNIAGNECGVSGENYVLEETEPLFFEQSDYIVSAKSLKNKGDCNRVNCSVSFATYRKALAIDCRIPYDNIPEDYELPEELDYCVYLDRKEKTLRLTSGGLKRKSIIAIKERDLLGGDEYGIITMMYKLSDQLGKGYVREPHYCDVELDFTNSDYIDQNKKLDETGAKITALRRNMGNDIWSLTIMFVNDDTGKSSAKSFYFFIGWSLLNFRFNIFYLFF